MRSRPKATRVVLAAVAVGGAVLARAATPAAPGALTYTKDGRAILPAGYRDWPFLTSSLDMTYGAAASTPDHHMLDNVFVSPAALAAFRASGHWPEGTVLAKEDRLAESHVSLNKSGFVQTEKIMAVELHVEDARMPGGWAFYAFGDETPQPPIPVSAECYTCHQAHGATETTFVQFYPTLAPVARAHGTFKEN